MMKGLTKENFIIKQRHTTAKIVAYILAIFASLWLLIFILSGSKSAQPSFMVTVIGIWFLFLVFCSYKIYRARQYRSVFRKGTLSVGELDDMDGIDFEELACEILVANGFELAENTPATGDFGVDILAIKDGMTYAIQCKRYHEPIGIEAVQQVFAGRAYYECHVAVVLGNQPFTQPAQKLADKLGVVLWDRETLRELL
ncbi:MAG: restriction endonuclease [Butyribacter sp.]|nr:restriction endonuclease [bacterium]MDY3854010.1 restriction endonuclease [Butyribacter sp.]